MFPWHYSLIFNDVLLFESSERCTLECTGYYSNFQFMLVLRRLDASRIYRGVVCEVLARDNQSWLYQRRRRLHVHMFTRLVVVEVRERTIKLSQRLASSTATALLWKVMVGLRSANEHHYQIFVRWVMHGGAGARPLSRGNCQLMCPPTTPRYSPHRYFKMVIQSVLQLCFYTLIILTSKVCTYYLNVSET